MNPLAAALGFSVAMPQYTLRTLGRLELVGPEGPCRVDDPIALPLLVLAALTPGGGIGDDDAMLRLTPDLTPAAGRARLASAVAAVTAAAGAALVEYDHGRLTLRRDQVAADVDAAAVAQANPPDQGFLAGAAFPSPEFGEWVKDIRPRIRAARAAGGPRSWLGTPNDRTAALIAIGGLILLFAVWGTRSTAPRGFTPGAAIVMADLDNATGDTLFDQSLTAAAAIGLRQSAQFALLPRGRVAAALQRMGQTRPDTVQLTLDLAREVAIRENAQFALGFRIERAGEGFRLSAVLADPASGEAIRSGTAEAETRGGTLVALDRLVQEIRAGLGEGRRERRGRSLTIPAASTPSLEALRSYAQGSAAWAAGRYEVARELWERSLDLDTGFAMARGALGSYYANHHNRTLAHRYYTEALARGTRLTEWERLRLEEGFADLRGETDSLLAIHRIIVAKYPSAVSWFNYGTDLMRARKHREASAALTTSLQFDSTWAGAYLNLAVVAKGLGELDEALDYYERAAVFDSSALYRGFQNAEYGDVLVRLGRFDEAERHFRKTADRPAVRDRISPLRSLGLLNIWRGRFEEGIGFLRQATNASIQIDGPAAIGALRGRLFEGLALLLQGDTTGANRAFDSLMAHVDQQSEPPALALYARGILRANRISDARRLLTIRRDTIRSDDRKSLDFIAAAVAIASGKPDSGLALLDAGAESPQRMVTAWVRIDGLVATGKSRQALALADSVVKDLRFGSESQFEWLFGLVRSADLSAELGDRKAALAGYRQLIDLWKNGDPASAPLDHAKKQLAALPPAR